MTAPTTSTSRVRAAAIVVAGVAAASFVALSVLAGDEQRRARVTAPARVGPAPMSRPHVVAPPAGRHRSSGVTANLRRAAGQTIVARMSGAYPSARLLRRARRGQIGGVILFADNVRSPDQVAAATAALQKAAARGGNPPLLIAVDQEGGQVKRFAAAPPSRSPADMGARVATAELEGRRTGAALRRAGVTVDLAPVLDVPARAGSFLGSRVFGRTGAAVAGGGCAFAAGLRGGGVLATAKHFPGLGHAPANTDLAAVTISAPAATLRAHYAPFQACIDRGAVDLVMMSNAAYPALDPAGRPAVFSRRIVGELRERLGFAGVVISDDLQAPGVQRVGDTAVRALGAGVDALLYAKTERASAAAYARVLAAVRRGRLPKGRIFGAAARMRALKGRSGNPE